jgi:hypothetical protein
MEDKSFLDMDSCKECSHQGQAIQCCKTCVYAHRLQIDQLRTTITTPDGWQLIADKISERGEWIAFMNWYAKKLSLEAELSPPEFFGVGDASFAWLSVKPSEKSKLVFESLQAGAIGRKDNAMPI